MNPTSSLFAGNQAQSAHELFLTTEAPHIAYFYPLPLGTPHCPTLDLPEASALPGALHEFILPYSKHVPLPEVHV